MQYTTGQVSGMTRIPVPTMRAYVARYREFFSPQAQIPNRGRRFSPEDVEKLLLIRHLSQERRSQEEIRQALAQGDRPDLEAFRLQDAALVYEQVKRLAAQAEDAARRADRAAYQNEYLHHRLKALEHTLKRLDEQVENLRRKRRVEEHHERDRQKGWRW